MPQGGLLVSTQPAQTRDSRSYLFWQVVGDHLKRPLKILPGSSIQSATVSQGDFVFSSKAQLARCLREMVVTGGPPTISNPLKNFGGPQKKIRVVG